MAVGGRVGSAKTTKLDGRAADRTMMMISHHRKMDVVYPCHEMSHFTSHCLPLPLDVVVELKKKKRILRERTSRPLLKTEAIRNASSVDPMTLALHFFFLSIFPRFFSALKLNFRGFNHHRIGSHTEMKRFFFSLPQICLQL